jgi:hypothetical protein
LQLKLAHARSPEQAQHIATELAELRQILIRLDLPVDISRETAQLYAVNQELWAIEDAKRQHEKRQVFDREFVELARSVYIKNDIRAQIKQVINSVTHSDIVEEKIHKDYS